MTDILKELREPLPKVEGYSGEYVDEDAVSDIFRDAADEIERLRGALHHYVRECDCNGGTFYEHDHITGKDLVKDCPKCEPARAALGGKK